jgi:ribose/xylose/arabinose/galactoside ABC-type transport system permease subunit
MIISSQVLTANARLATGLELSAIAVVVLGGTALSGGQATMVGTLLGALLISMINNGLNLLNVPIFYQELTVGVLMLGALALSISKGFNFSNLLRREA